MSSYLISGGRPLNGQLHVHGSKNAALPIIAASLLYQGVTVIRGCPDILDVRYMIKILRSIGCGVVYQDDMLQIDASEICLENIFPGMYRKDAFFNPASGGGIGTVPSYDIGLSRWLYDRGAAGGYPSESAGADGSTY